MARKIDTLKINNFEVDVYYDKGAMCFTAQFGNSAFTRSSMMELKKELTEAMNSTTQYDWRPIILVQYKSFDYVNGAVIFEQKLQIERLYIYRDNSGQAWSCEYEVAPERRENQKKRFWTQDGLNQAGAMNPDFTLVIDYVHETWMRLHLEVADLMKANEKVIRLIEGLCPSK